MSNHLNRDHELEQQTGECSYCGHPLQFVTLYEALDYEAQGGYFASCPSCDEYDEWGWADSFPEGVFE